MSAFRLDDEVAMITGGGSGIGLGIARCMIKAGARVVLVGRRRDPLRLAAEELGPACTAEPFDVTWLSEAPVLIERVSSRVGPVTILVNNAGIHLKKYAADTTEAEFIGVLNTHVVGAHAMTRAVAPSMVRGRHGSILFISSMAALFGLPQVVAYAAAKSAYLGMVRTLAAELSPEGVRVNAIAPGWINSHMLKHLDDDPQRRDKILERTPMHQFGEPEDIGNAAVYLCSKAGRFVTGVVLPVDGGVSIGF